MKPPQNPTMRNALRRGEMMPVFCMIPIIKPNNRHPEILMTKVAIGNGSFQKFINSLLIRKRAEEPKNPPQPASNASLNMIIS